MSRNEQECSPGSFVNLTQTFSTSLPSNEVPTQPGQNSGFGDSAPQQYNGLTQQKWL